jgi:hypothetical protein
MSIDVQILSSALLKLVQSTIQQTLDTTCVPIDRFWAEPMSLAA